MNKMEHYGNKNIVHKRIKEAREALGISQGELAARMQTLNVNMDQQMVSKIERNLRIVKDYEIVCFAKALKVSEKQLLSQYEDLCKS